MITGNLWGYLLKELNITHTKKYIYELYNTCNDRGNLYGTAKMLDIYNIDYVIVFLDKKDLFDLSSLVIATFNNGLIVVKQLDVDNNEILFINSDLLHVKMDLDVFAKQLGNVAIIIKDTEHVNNEPYYKSNILNEFVLYAKFIYLFVFVFILIFNWGMSDCSSFVLLSLFFNALGLFVSLLLIFKRMNIKLKINDTLCSILTHSDCTEEIAHSSLFFRLVNLPALGVAYFGFNMFLFVFFSNNIGLYFYVNAMSLFFSLLGIWYLKYRVKQWCVLCLLIHLNLWFIFIVDMIYYKDSFPIINMDMLSIYGLIPCMYFITDSSITSYKKRYSSYKNKRMLNFFKSNKNVIEAVFSKQKIYNTLDSSIVIGNIHAALNVTIYFSLKCSLCKQLNEQILSFARKKITNLKIHYVFNICSKEEEEIVGIFMNYSIKNKNSIGLANLVNEWFVNGVANPQYFIMKYSEYKSQNNCDILEIENYAKWANQNQLTGTPIVFVNGKMMPSVYRLSDVLVYHELYEGV